MSTITKESIVQIIKNEDKKNPLTDGNIAELINTSREKITELRLSNNIPDSRERRRQALYKDAEEILSDCKDISERQFTKLLNEKGYKISRYIVSQIKNEIIDQIELKEHVAEKVEESVQDEINKEEFNDESSNNDTSPFSEIIGSNESLKLQISQAKAAILYPPNGLHTLLLGPSGVGKSCIAEAMYRFAIGSGNFKKDAPFIIFNCADYADNPQLLLSQLFGYTKGAFTGADNAKAGLVEKADGGILFLDEVHRLPSEGQEILFYLLDKGMFRRLGETESTRKANIMLITATTENPESFLLLTFRRRIPMVIEIPALKERSFKERYKIIKEFFLNESFRVGKTISIESDVIRALMLYDCPGNIGQLRSDIQVACARGFLNSMGDKNSNISIVISDLPDYVKMGLFKVDKKEERVDKFLNHCLIVNPNRSVVTSDKEREDLLQYKIYQFIEERFVTLEKQGLNKEEINDIVGKQVETELKRLARNVNYNITVSKKELREIVGDKILNATDNAIKIAKSNFNTLQDNLYYSLAIHLSAACDRLRAGKSIINPQLQNIIKEYPLEYRIAEMMGKSVSVDLGVKIPEDEIAFIAMYLRTFSGDKEPEEGRVGVIVLSHGHVAFGMAEVANRLLGVNHAVGIEMDLNESPSSILDKTIEIVKRIDEGKGCILLADMGSLVGFGDIITKETGIPIKTIGRVDTLMVLEAVRRAIVPTSALEEIASVLGEDKKYDKTPEVIVEERVLPKAIVTICITGEGTALRIKKYIEELIPEIKDEVRIVPVGMMKQRDIEKEIKKIKKENDVVAFVGTINPNIDNIPFISVEDAVNPSGKKRILRAIGKQNKPENKLGDIISESLILPNLNVSVKNDAIDCLVNLLVSQGYVDKEFMLSVYKREAIGATYLEGGIAIPHGASNHVIKPAIAVAKLARPLEWQGENMVNLVFMIALKEDSTIYFNNLYEIISNEKELKALMSAESEKEMMEVILNNTIPTE